MPSLRNTARTIAALGLLLISLQAPLHAQDAPLAPPAASPAADPPGRVARIAVAQGNVSLEPAGVDTFAEAELNYPLTAGDRVYADLQALAELQSAGLALRLANGADLTIASLTDSVAQFGLAQGSIHLATRDLNAPDGSQAVVEVDTPNGSILVQMPGDIRIDSYPQSDTTVVTVTSGQVEISAPNIQQVLGPGQSLELTGNPVSVRRMQLLEPDALDRFDTDREAEFRAAFGPNEYPDQPFVSPDMIGAGDLAQYGSWSPDADYGEVWFPSAVAVGWTPYHNGHWAWVAPWGWTWVESEPWGFAPFHYGRWATFNGRWGWCPGPPPILYGRPVRPIYSPALVAFVGGPGFSLSIGFGERSGAGVTAWFPLGPREPFVPWYHASPVYVNRVNVTNLPSRNAREIRNIYSNRTTNVYDVDVTNITYVNRTVATTAVTQRDFSSGRHIQAAQAIRLDENARAQLNQAPILKHPMVTPAASIATPQAPARALPPTLARPVLTTPNPLNRPELNRTAAGNTTPPAPAPAPNPYAPRPGADHPGSPAPSLPTTRTPQPSPEPVQSAQPTRPAPVERPAAPPALATPAAATPAPASFLRQPIAARPLINRTEPQAVQPSFQQQREEIERTEPGRPLGPQQVENIRQGRPAAPAVGSPAPPEYQRPTGRPVQQAAPPAPAARPSPPPAAARPAPPAPAPAKPAPPEPAKPK